MPRKRGRKPKHYVTDKGDTIVGLTRSTDGRFRPVGVPNVSFGSDEAKAIHKFRVWKSKQEPEPTVDLELDYETYSLDEETGVLYLDKHPLTERTVNVRDRETGEIVAKPLMRVGLPMEIPLAAIVPWIRAQLAEPRKAALLFDWEPLNLLANVEGLEHYNEQSLTLDKPLQLYKSKRIKPKPEELQKVTRTWQSFTDSVSPQALTLAEITTQQIEQWADRIFEQHDNGGSSKSVHHAIDRVSRVLRYVRERKQLDKKNCTRLLDALATIELPELPDNAPNPISREHYHKLLTAANGTQWEPMLIIMLNCCYYPVDVRTLPVKALDLTNGTIYFERAKKKTPRVAVLWQRTIESVSHWLKQHPSKSSTVFVSTKGTGFAAEGLRTAFRKLRTRAGLPETVTMDSIRDGAYSAAVNAPEVNEKTAKILAGHRLSGETDAYAKRNVSAVRPAVQAIEEHYFG